MPQWFQHTCSWPPGEAYKRTPNMLAFMRRNGIEAKVALSSVEEGAIRG
jgi:hypothetical protein